MRRIGRVSAREDHEGRSRRGNAPFVSRGEGLTREAVAG